MKDLIYNQRKIPKKQWRYGLASSARTGCGWIAVYNALCLLGRYVAPEKLIRSFEWQLPILNGTTGTPFWGPAALLRRMGYRVELCFRRRKFDEIARRNDVCVMYYYWRQRWKLGAHFVALQYRDGRFVGYNTFSGSDGPDDYGESLEGFLRRHRYFFCILTGISRKK